MIKDVRYLEDVFELEFEEAVPKSIIDETEGLKEFFEKIGSIDDVKFKMVENTVTGIVIPYQVWLNMISGFQSSGRSRQLEDEFEMFFEKMRSDHT